MVCVVELHVNGTVVTNWLHSSVPQNPCNSDQMFPLGKAGRARDTIGLGLGLGLGVRVRVLHCIVQLPFIKPSRLKYRVLFPLSSSS